MVAVTAAVDLLSLDDDFSSAPAGGNSSSLNAEQSALVHRNVYAASLVKGLTTKNPVYTNSFVEITVASDYRNHQGRVVLFVHNKSNRDIRNIGFDVTSPAIDQQFLNVRTQITGTNASGGEEVRAQVAIECMRPFHDEVIGQLTFQYDGSAYKYDLPLPIYLPNFCMPLPSDKNTYMTRWKAITAEKTEAQQVFSAGKPITPEMIKHVQTVLMPGMSVGVAEGLDNDKTFTGSCTFMTGTAGADGKPVAVGALMRLEGEPAANKYRITVRATHPTVSAAIKDFIVQQLS